MKDFITMIDDASGHIAVGLRNTSDVLVSDGLMIDMAHNGMKAECHDSAWHTRIQNVGQKKTIVKDAHGKTLTEVAMTKEDYRKGTAILAGIGQTIVKGLHSMTEKALNVAEKARSASRLAKVTAVAATMLIMASSAHINAATMVPSDNPKTAAMTMAMENPGFMYMYSDSKDGEIYGAISTGAGQDVLANDPIVREILDGCSYDYIKNGNGDTICVSYGELNESMTTRVREDADIKVIYRQSDEEKKQDMINKAINAPFDMSVAEHTDEIHPANDLLSEVKRGTPDISNGIASVYFIDCMQGESSRSCYKDNNGNVRRFTYAEKEEISKVYDRTIESLDSRSQNSYETAMNTAREHALKIATANIKANTVSHSKTNTGKTR